MAEVTIIGFPQSNYVRTARMACEEKGVSHDLEPLDIGSEELKAIHPFSKIPALRHGDLEIWETSAICRYIDDAFDGPALTPSSPVDKAMMEQWISAGNAYYDREIMRAVVMERLVAPRFGREPNEEKIADALPRIAYQMEVLSDWLGKHDYLAGGQASIADYLMVPIMFYAYMAPDTKPMVEDKKPVLAWWDRVASRPSFAATAPPMPSD